MKLCVQPLSISTAIGDALTWPNTLRVWGIEWHINACKMIWVNVVSRGFIGLLGVKSLYGGDSSQGHQFLGRSVQQSIAWTPSYICDQADTTHRNNNTSSSHNGFCALQERVV